MSPQGVTPEQVERLAVATLACSMAGIDENTPGLEPTSGQRNVARRYLRALEAAGFSVVPASHALTSEEADELVSALRWLRHVQKALHLNLADLTRDGAPDWLVEVLNGLAGHVSAEDGPTARAYPKLLTLAAYGPDEDAIVSGGDESAGGEEGGAPSPAALTAEEVTDSVMHAQADVQNALGMMELTGEYTDTIANYLRRSLAHSHALLDALGRPMYSPAIHPDVKPLASGGTAPEPSEEGPWWQEIRRSPEPRSSGGEG